jgi:hypothetical protein
MASGHKIPSGTAKVVRKLHIEFWEYRGLSTACNNQKTIPSNIYRALQDSSSGKISVQGNDLPLLVNDKWIYFFKKIGVNKYSIAYEVKPDVLNAAQQYKIVSWTKNDAQLWASTYPRAPENKIFEQFTIDSAIDYYIILSRIQLTYKRIVELISDGDAKILPRSFRIPANIDTKKQSVYPLYLLDYLFVADNMKAACDENVSNFEKFVRDPEKAKLRYMTEMIHSLSDKKVKPEIKDWLDLTASENEREGQSTIMSDLQTKKENAIGQLAALMSINGYKQTLFDYNGTKELEDTIFQKYASHIEVMDADPVGLEYLERTAGEEESWLNHYFTGEEPFLFYRKFSDLLASKEAREFVQKHILGLFLKLIKPHVVVSIEILITIQQKIISEVSSIFTRANIAIPELVQHNGSYFWVAEDPWSKAVTIKYETTISVEIQIKTSKDFSAREAARKKWEERIGKVNHLCKCVLLTFEVINLISKIKLFKKSKETTETIFAGVEVVASIAESIKATDFLIKEKLVEEFGKEAADKFFARVTVVGAICIYAGALKDVYKASNEKNVGLVFGYSVIALSAVATGAAAGAEITGAAVFGFAAGPISLLGLALFVAGSILVWAFTEEDLEKWAKKCKYGKRYESGYSLTSQIYDLHEVLCKFQVECYLLAIGRDPFMGATSAGYLHYDYFFTLKVSPGLMYDGSSKFLVDFSIKYPGTLFDSTQVLFSGRLVLPDNKTEVMREKGTNGPITGIFRRFGKDDLNLIDNFQNYRITYEYSAHLDLNGDGSVLLPLSPLTDDGTFQIRSFDS